MTWIQLERHHVGKTMRLASKTEKDAIITTQGTCTAVMFSQAPDGDYVAKMAYLKTDQIGAWHGILENNDDETFNARGWIITGVDE